MLFWALCFELKQGSTGRVEITSFKVANILFLNFFYLPTSLYMLFFFDESSRHCFCHFQIPSRTTVVETWWWS